MNKRNILKLDDTIATIKEYKTPLEKLSKGVNMDLDTIIAKRHMEHFWEENL